MLKMGLSFADDQNLLTFLEILRPFGARDIALSDEDICICSSATAPCTKTEHCSLLTQNFCSILYGACRLLPRRRTSKNRCRRRVVTSR